MKGRLYAVIPCAGLSSRMGRFKPMLELKNRPLLRHAIDVVSSAGPVEIRVVLGHRAETLEPLVRKAGARSIRNPAFAEGMLSSIRAGVNDLASGYDTFLLLPADIPLVRPATVQHLAEVSRKNPHRIVYPVFLGRRGHPPFIPTDLIPDILQGNDNGGLRKILKKFDDRAIDVPVMDENILFDLDCPEDYEAARKRITEADHRIVSQVFHPAEKSDASCITD